MTQTLSGRPTSAPSPSGLPTVDELLTSLLAKPWGQVSSSVYETARLVTLAPWLRGHAERVGYLLQQQRPDGAWGGPEGYALVPTLSAVEALLSTARRADSPPTVASAADRGLIALSRWRSGSHVFALPDTPAIEIIAPALVRAVNRHLAALRHTPVAALAHWAAAQVSLPSDLSESALLAVESIIDGGGAVPDKLLHSLEVAGPLRQMIAGLRPAAPGAVGASPAATAAWLGGEPARDRNAVHYLETLATRDGGAVPSVTPVTAFERAWVVTALADAGAVGAIQPEIGAELAAAIGPAGAAGGAGLPPDADTTSTVLVALARLGRPVNPDCLDAFATPTHFQTWHGERTASVSTNAHVLEALGRLPAAVGPRTGRVRRNLSRWLVERQGPDGAWTDKWHASPYYASACSALALHRAGRGPEAGRAVRSTVEWVVDTQRSDGSWGRWGGTPEETSYAMQILLLTRAAVGSDGAAVGDAPAAAVRGHTYLLDAAGRVDDPPLWHDKDLYLPAAVVRANLLSALRLAERHLPSSPPSAPAGGHAN
jgi:hypothetical protein